MNIPSSRLPKHSSDLVNGASGHSHSPTLMKRLLHKYSHSAPRASPPPRLLLVVLLSAQILFLAIVRLGPSSPIWSSKAPSPAEPSNPSVSLPSSLPVDFSAHEDAGSLERSVSNVDGIGTQTSSDESLTSSSGDDFTSAVSKDEGSLIRNDDTLHVSEKLLEQPSTSEKKKKKASSKKKKKKSDSDPPKEITSDVPLLNEQSGEAQSSGESTEKTEEASSVGDKSGDLLLSTEDKTLAESTNDNAILQSLDVEEKQDKNGTTSELSYAVARTVEEEEVVGELVERNESSDPSSTEEEKEKATPNVADSEKEQINTEGNESETKYEVDLVQKEEVQRTEEAAPEITQHVEDKSFDANAQNEVLVSEKQGVEESTSSIQDPDRTVDEPEMLMGNLDSTPSEEVTIEKESAEETTSSTETQDKSVEDQKSHTEARVEKETETFIVQKTSEGTSSSECPNGYIYVYDLPQVFNLDIIANCTTLDPWVDVCPNLLNGGLGESLEDASPLGLKGSWFITNQFTAEVVFHNRMLQHPCLTDKQEVASGFYVPFYAGLDVGRYLWAGSTVEHRDQLSKQLMEWLAQQPAWKQNGGRDHFLMVGRITWDFRRSEDGGWGSGFFHHRALRNTTRLVIERNPWDEIEMAVPYPTNFHPQSDADLRAWQNHIRNYKRSTLFSFAGAPRQRFPDDFRAILFEQCHQAEQCRSLDCTNRTCEDNQKTLELFMDSTFCLQPRGDSFTRRSTFDCLLAGSIPVFFWHRSAYLQYKWHLPSDESSYSVFISRTDVRNGTQIEDVLKSLPPEKVRSMQEAVIQMIPRIVYAVSGFSLKEEKDAFDVAIDGVMRSFKGYLK